MSTPSNSPATERIADAPPATNAGGGPNKTAADGEPPPKSGGLKPSRAQWFVLLVVLGADVMDLLDSTVVNVGAPSISRDLHASSTQLQWVIASYTLLMAVALITSGRLGDLFGRKRMFMAGVGAFTVFSALSSAAQSPQMLITARALQGLAAALMLAQGLAVIRSVFPPDQAGAAMGIFGPVMGIAATLGPIVGGALIQADLFGTQWRSIFWINVPIGLIAFLCAVRVIPKDTPHGPDAPTLDVVGVLTSGLGMLLLVYPLIEGRVKDWPAYMYVMMAAAVPVFGLFWLQQRRRERGGRTPLVTPSLFGKAGFTGGLVFGLFFFAGMGGLFLVLMLHLQLALGYSSLHAGLTGLPFSLGAAVGAGLGGALLAPKFGRRVLHLGVLLMGLGIAGVAWTAHAAGSGLSTWDLVPAYGVCGLGMGLLITTFFAIVVSAVDDHETGSAGGVINALQQLGNSLGVALFGTLYFNGLTAGHGSVSAVTSTLLWAAAGTALCVPLGFLLPRYVRPGVADH